MVTATDRRYAAQTPKPLSPYYFRQVLQNLAAFTKADALRQLELHAERGDFTTDDCAALADAVTSDRALLA